MRSSWLFVVFLAVFVSSCGIQVKRKYGSKVNNTKVASDTDQKEAEPLEKSSDSRSDTKKEESIEEVEKLPTSNLGWQGLEDLNSMKIKVVRLD